MKTLLALLTFAVLLPLPLSADPSDVRKSLETKVAETATEENEAPLARPERAERESAALKYLPNGTSLVQVVLPSYDENRKVSSVMEAQSITLISKEKQIMEGLEVVLSLKEATGKTSFQTKMARALYYYNAGLLDSQEKTVLESDTMYLRGQAALYDLNEKQFFLKGPVLGRFVDTSLSTRLIASLLSSAALLSAPADPPSDPRPQLLSALQASRSSSASAELTADLSAKKTQHDEELKVLTGSVEEGMTRFFQKAAQNELLVQGEGRAEKLTPPKERRPVLKAPPGALELSCEGGIYYDYEAGHLVCLKNVRVTDPRFVLTCDEELKIILETAPEEKKEEELAGMSTGQVSEMMATGNVVITYKAVEGEPMIATGQTAHYEAATEEILLDGGLPTFRQGQHFFEALEPSVWVKLSRKGFSTGPGKKRTVYLPTQDQ